LFAQTTRTRVNYRCQTNNKDNSYCRESVSMWPSGMH